MRWRWHCGTEGAPGHGSTAWSTTATRAAQYTSIRYTERLLETGVRAWIGTVGDSFDNAMAESVNALYKAELVYWEGPWDGADDLELATLGWVDWFNNTRLHSMLQYRTPAETESEHYRDPNTPAERPLAGQLTL